MASFQKVDITTPDAKLNEFSMNNNKGGRVIYILQKDEVVLVKGRKVIVINIKK